MSVCDKDGLICSQRIVEDLEKECLNPCEGVFADIKRLPVKNLKTVQYKLLVKSYSKHSRFNESEYRIPSKLLSTQLIFFRSS